MKTFENSKKTGSFNGVISHINNVDAKTFILKHKKLFSLVTEPFMYSGIEIDVKTLAQKKCYKDEHGTYYILGFKKVWQLDEVPEVKQYNFNGAQLIAKAVPEHPANCIGCFFVDITPCPTMPMFKEALPDCLSLQVPFIYVEINK